MATKRPAQRPAGANVLQLPEGMSLATAAVVVATGVVAGFLNVVAGGGSLLTMPVLIFVGLPETVANGTARLAILAQNATAVWRYHSAGRLDLSMARTLGLPTLAGALVGSTLATYLPDTGFRALLGWVMLVAAAAVIAGPGNLLGDERVAEPRLRTAIIWPVFLLVGFYGGLIQAAVGYLLLAALVFVVGLDLVEANIMKVVMVFIYTPFAIVIFAAGDKINLASGLLLACGQAAGAWLGAAAALKKGSRFIRWVLALTVLLAALKLLGVGDAWLPPPGTPT